MQTKKYLIVKEENWTKDCGSFSSSYECFYSKSKCIYKKVYFVGANVSGEQQKERQIQTSAYIQNVLVLAQEFRLCILT